MENFNVLDLFCGCGGISLGFSLVGCKIVGGVDFDKAAIETFKHNFPGALGLCTDINTIDNDFIKNNFSDVDIIIGGPPCQGFSSANRWQKEIDDVRNKLFFQYIRFIEIIKPKAFLIENVKEILTKDNGYAKDRILEITSSLGYDVSFNILLASDYGVPQKRRRAFFVGVRKDMNKKFDFNNLLKTEEVVSVVDAIGDLCGVRDSKSSTFLQYANNSTEILNHEIKYPNEKVIERIKCVPQGGNWKDVPSYLWETQRDNRHSSAYRRLDFKEPSITIDTGHMNYFHPVENRVPTVRESARLQSFPDSFVFKGTQTQQYRQVGNAVPPLLSRAIANELLKLIK